jgi:HK97 gp10 family phage protein
MDFKSNLSEVLDKLKKANIAICQDIGKRGVADTQPVEPRDTGNMVRSTTYEVHSDGMGVDIGVTVDAPYAKWVEEGTSKMDARPFLEPTMMKDIPVFEDTAKQHITTNMGG